MEQLILILVYGAKMIKIFSETYQRIFCYICRNIIVMIRKRTAIFFILLANIVLLVHAVVPHHHHHNSDVCTESSTCQTDGKSYEHSDCKHNESSKEHYDCCVLKQVVTVPVNQIKPEFKCLVCDDDHHNLDTFHSLLFTSCYSNLPIEYFAVKWQNYKPSFKLQFVSTGFGLRAPPIV